MAIFSRTNKVWNSLRGEYTSSDQAYKDRMQLKHVNEAVKNATKRSRDASTPNRRYDNPEERIREEQNEIRRANETAYGTDFYKISKEEQQKRINAVGYKDADGNTVSAGDMIAAAHRDGGLAQSAQKDAWRQDKKRQDKLKARGINPRHEITSIVSSGRLADIGRGIFMGSLAPKGTSASEAPTAAAKQQKKSATATTASVAPTTTPTQGDTASSGGTSTATASTSTTSTSTPSTTTATTSPTAATAGGATGTAGATPSPLTPAASPIGFSYKAHVTGDNSLRMAGAQLTVGDFQNSEDYMKDEQGGFRVFEKGKGYDPSKLGLKDKLFGDNPDSSPFDAALMTGVSTDALAGSKDWAGSDAQIAQIAGQALDPDNMMKGAGGPKTLGELRSFLGVDNSSLSSSYLSATEADRAAQEAYKKDHPEYNPADYTGENADKDPALAGKVTSERQTFETKANLAKTLDYYGEQGFKSGEFFYKVEKDESGALHHNVYLRPVGGDGSSTKNQSTLIYQSEAFQFDANTMIQHKDGTYSLFQTPDAKVAYEKTLENLN